MTRRLYLPKAVHILPPINFSKLNWKEKRFGLKVGADHVTNLQFPDDIVLIEKSEQQTMMT